VHTDAAFKYTNVRIHDNVLTAAVPGDSRGINIGYVAAGTSGSIYNNILYNVGQDFAGIALYGGDWNVYNNTLYNIRSPYGMLQVNGAAGTTVTGRVYNNGFYSDGSSPYVAAVNGGTLGGMTFANNLYYNKGAGPAADTTQVNGDPMFVAPASGNFRLQASSPAINKGAASATAVVATDHDGNSRLLNGVIDIGAFEFGSK
jgi:hypothetical protein